MIRVTLFIALQLSFICSWAQVYDCSTGRFSQEVFSSYNAYTDIPYGENQTIGGEKQELSLDLFEPIADTLDYRPLIIFAHGGYFRFGDRVDFEEQCWTLAQRGYVTATIDYRMWDKLGTPDSSQQAELLIQGMGDMKAAVRFFKADAAGPNLYGIDTNQIYVAGYSCGAMLSLYTAFLDDESELPYWMQSILTANGGVEGNSGNEGFSSKVNGVISITGGVPNEMMMDKDDCKNMMFFHGTDDEIVPFEKGLSKDLEETDILFTCGASVLHNKAKELGLNSTLNSPTGWGHDILNLTSTIDSEISNFIAPLVCNKVTGTVKQPEMEELLFYPNPAVEEITIPRLSEQVQYDIIDVSGQIVDMGMTQQHLYVGHLEAGIYFFRAVLNGKKLVGRFEVR